MTKLIVNQRTIRPPTFEERMKRLCDLQERYGQVVEQEWREGKYKSSQERFGNGYKVKSHGCEWYIRQIEGVILAQAKE